MKIKLLVVFILFLITLSYSVSDTDNPLEKCEDLITELKFYDALVALEPLLTDNKKSDDQEKAFWIANILCNKLTGILSDEYLEYYQGRKSKIHIRGDLIKEWGKLNILDRLGSGIGWSPPGGVFVHHYAFLKRLVELYPNTSWRPAAEYYLILEGKNYPQSTLSIDKTLNTLYLYIKKYENRGLSEIYLAYRDIAHINHGRWALLMHPNVEGPCGPVVFPQDVTEEDKKQAAIFKAEALKYYAKIIVGSPWIDQRKYIQRYYQDLKENKPTGHDFIRYDI